MKIGPAVFLFTFCFYGIAGAETISSAELIACPSKYDQQAVVYQGEAIGDVMERGDYAWVNLNDNSGAIGVWMSKEAARGIGFTGSYKAKGDWIEVSGILNRVCSEHGGDLDIHAAAIRKVAPGGLLRERINGAKQNTALVLLGGLCLVLILRLFKKQ